MHSARPWWRTPTEAKKPVREEIYLGLMSGTSMDGIDAALARFPETGAELIATHSHPWPDDLRRQLKDLTRPGENEIDRLGRLDALAGETFAAAALELLAKAGVAPSAVTAIGSHGQTIRHRPDGETPFTLQIGDPNRIAERTGITTVADFRRRDMAAGGEGAPLAPAFHAHIFRNENEARCVLNIGGIANLTLLPANREAPATGFDTGPGNCLLDAWSRRHLNRPFDRDGAWATTGKVSPSLLEAMLADAYFRRPPPKSTGVEYFSPDWLDRRLGSDKGLGEADIQATLTALTAESIARGIKGSMPGCRRILVCGGGVHNNSLMRQLRDRLDQHEVESTAAHGMDPDWIEAVAFAWLARQTLWGKPGNLPSVTGANHSVVLGGVYL
ncbi:MAG TPA: anhydro-N-acetylmuramic acid kinase [Sedimenticola sp.]|nr:anhydro-N-acetylmuramic acid kinase [Sedimenticola sp.]